MTDTTTPAKENGFIGDVLDGALKMYGINEGAFSNFAQRLGAFASVAVPAVVINDRVRVKPAIKKLGAASANQIIAEMPLGTLTVGKVK